MQYVCAKCGNTHYESDQFQATGGNFAKIFDIQNKKFVTVTCTRCGYTELYKQQGSEAWDTVSYTHLDVYKRQGYPRRAPDEGSNEKPLLLLHGVPPPIILKPV